MGSIGSSSNVSRSTTESGLTTSASSVYLNAERDMPSFYVSNVEEKDYKLQADIDMSHSVVTPGDTFGIRILGSRNYDVYGKVQKVTDSLIIVNWKGSEYTFPINKVEISGTELRFEPKDKNDKWVGFVDLRKYYTKDDFKK